MKIAIALGSVVQHDTDFNPNPNPSIFLSLFRAVNFHALSVSLMPGHCFSRSHAKHVKSPASKLS